MRLPTALLLMLFHLLGAAVAQANNIVPVVEVEEVVYEFTPANNGAGPMWCHGSTTIARIGNRVFVTGLETLEDAAPLNNCRWLVMERGEAGWRKIYTDPDRTREPSPIAVFNDGRLFVSANPTIVQDPKQYAGPAQPAVLEFSTKAFEATPRAHPPDWDGAPPFSEHSYRSFAADPQTHQLILFQNIGYTHAEWSFLDGSGTWSSQGRLDWPPGRDYAKPQPIRICYPNVALRNRAVYFCGVSDIQEPNPEWREFKRKLTGREWDYDFRRLFFSWSPDVTTQGFTDWIEVSSREKTAGWITPGDLWVAPDGDVHVVWNERALDERLRGEFFPGEKQSHGLYHALLRDGEVVSRRALVLAEEGGPDDIPGRGRFHVSSTGELFVVCAVNRRIPAGRSPENWLISLDGKGQPSSPIQLPLERAFTDFFTATPRAGSPPGSHLDLFGVQAGLGNTMSYARIRIE